jgi:hypothetical protein
MSNTSHTPIHFRTVSDQYVAIEQAVALVQSRLSNEGETSSVSKPDSWRFIGLDLRLGRGYTVRLTPTEEGVHVEAFSPAGWPAAAPETTGADITADDLADLILTLYRRASG